MKYDYLIVGAGLYGAVFAHEAKKKGKNCLVIDKRDHIAGNIYCEEIEGINVHKYGAHIFHTSNKKIWEYINQFAEFNNYINSPIAVYKVEDVYKRQYLDKLKIFEDEMGVCKCGIASEKIVDYIIQQIKTDQ